MPVELSEIQRAIKLTGAKWIAGETAISQLAPELRAKLVLPVKFEIVPSIRPMTPLPPPPAKLDWTNIGGEDFVTSVKMQEGSSCVIWSSTAALESSVLKSHLVPNTFEFDLAEEGILNSPESGLPDLSFILAFMKDTGLPKQEWFPWYFPIGKTGWRDHTFRITGWADYYPTSVDEVKALIAQYGPVLTCMNVTESLFYYRGGIWSNSACETHPGGGHEVLVVGYDDSTQCFKVKNSWGKGWGESRNEVHTSDDNGFFRIAYSEFKRSPVGFGGIISTLLGPVGPDIPPGVWPNGKKINTYDLAQTAPSACVFNNKLYLFWKGAFDVGMWYSASSDGITWPKGKLIYTSDLALTAPSACVFNNKLYLFWKGSLNASMWYSASSDGIIWPQGKKINDYDIAIGAPSVCVYKNKLYLFWKGALDASIWYSASSDGITWPQGKKINEYDLAPEAPSACIAFGQLYLFWRGARDKSIWYSASKGAYTWPPGNKINAFDTALGAPSASCELLYNKVYLFWRNAFDESISYGASTNGITWSQGKKINASDIAPGKPSVCAFNHNLYLFWRGARDRSMWYSAL